MPRDYDDEYEELDDDIEEIEDDYVDDGELFDDDDADGRDRRKKSKGSFSRMIGQITGAPQRPGEQDVVRSPVILWLTGGSVVVGLLAAILWFMIAKKTAEGQYKQAKDEMDGRKYAQAIELYDQFIEDYPDHDLTHQAMVDRGVSKVEKELSGADVKAKPSLDAIDEFVKARRDDDDFAEYKPKLRAWLIDLVQKSAGKAERTKKRDILDISEKAEKILNQYAPKEGFKKELLDNMRTAQLNALRAIRKEEEAKDVIASIKQLIKEKKTIEALRERRNVIKRLEELDSDGNVTWEHDKDFQALLTEILTTEQAVVAVDKTPREASTEERPNSATALTFAPHSRASTTERSDGRTVFTTAADAIYGVDAVTGTPLWRRVIGLNTPFAPIAVEASVSAILLFDTNHNELVLIAHADGSLIWRTPFPGEIAKTPLIHESQVFMPTDQNNLYAVGLGTGRVSAKATFSQELFAPPALSADKDHMVIPGEEELVYTLKLRPLECIDVSWLGQKAGTIRAPMVKMGRLLLMVENHESNSARLKVLRGEPNGSDLKVLDTVSVDGHVFDPPVLRGRTLFVASNPQQITAFTVSDEADQDTIARVATNQLQDVPPTRMFLVPRPGGEVFLAGASMRKFKLESDTLVVDQAETAVGIHLMPPQVIGKRFYMTRREPWAQSVYFTEADSDTLTSYWRVVLGTRLLAYAHQESGMFTAVTDTGTTFRIKEEDIQKGGFVEAPIAQEYQPEGLVAPIGGTRLHDNRLAVYWGDPKPQIVIINAAGQPSAPIRLPAQPESTPVALTGGIVVPVPGALQVVNTNRGARRVTDYRAPQVQGEDSQWKSLTRLDDTQVVGVDTKNRMIQVQLRTPSGGQANLAEVRIVDLDAAIDHAPVLHDKYLLTVDAAKTLSVLDARSLEPLATKELPAVATSRAWGAGDKVFVDVGNTQVLVFQIGADLTETGRIDSQGATLAGAPVPMGDGFLVALESGELVLTDADGNEAGQRIRLGQDVQSGPIQAGGSMVVVGVDGSLLHIDPLLQRSE